MVMLKLLIMVQICRKESILLVMLKPDFLSIECSNISHLMNRGDTYGTHKMNKLIEVLTLTLIIVYFNNSTTNQTINVQHLG